ncbi:MAG: TonB-dependent receptor [Herbaspirillum sp.]|jgi:iron complex outermembrane receptor protein|nr:TonB-dependent receptor [Herbaspirillum sp.]
MASIGGAAWGQTQTPADQALAPVLVSASRFDDESDATPVGATVITAAQIRQAGVDNVNQAIRSIGGVYGRQNSYGSSDFSLDLRGFGATADQNTVILVDGVRLSENELSVALLSSIPIETVERIEIVRGGSSVLYGEGATAGTIQIITKRPQRDTARGTMVAEAGSFGRRGLRLALARDWDGLSLDVNAANLESDNYRANNRLRQQNLGGGLQWSGEGRRIGVRVDSSDQHYRTPGALTMAQYQNDPRSSFTPDDAGSTRVDRVSLFGEQRLGAFELAVEWAQRDKTYFSHTVGSYGISDYTTRSRTEQFSPRLRHTAQFGPVRNELVIGVDVAESKRNADSLTSAATGQQRSIAVYARDEIRRGDARLAFGVRRETFDQRSADPLAFDAGGDYRQKQTLSAWDLQGSLGVASAATVFAKAGRSYRVANIDENGFTLTPGRMLLPQTSDDLAFGATFGNARQALTVTLFQNDLRNEIMYDPTVDNPGGFQGANVNLDPTQRRGVELEMRTQLREDLDLNASFRHIDARFRSGVNAGKEVVLVPRNTASARLNWKSGPHSARIGAQWVSRQRYGSDFTNTCAAQMPSYVTVEGRYAITVARWELALTGVNLGNRQYFSQAYGCQSGIYPEAGRQLILSARYDF